MGWKSSVCLELILKCRSILSIHVRRLKLTWNMCLQTTDKASHQIDKRTIIILTRSTQFVRNTKHINWSKNQTTPNSTTIRSTQPRIKNINFLENQSLQRIIKNQIQIPIKRKEKEPIENKKMQTLNEKTMNQTWGNGIEKRGGIWVSNTVLLMVWEQNKQEEAIGGNGSGWI